MSGAKTRNRKLGSDRGSFRYFFSRWNAGWAGKSLQSIAQLTPNQRVSHSSYARCYRRTNYSSITQPNYRSKSNWAYDESNKSWHWSSMRWRSIAITVLLCYGGRRFPIKRSSSASAGQRRADFRSFRRRGTATLASRTRSSERSNLSGMRNKNRDIWATSSRW